MIRRHGARQQRAEQLRPGWAREHGRFTPAGHPSHREPARPGQRPQTRPVRATHRAARRPACPSAAPPRERSTRPPPCPWPRVERVAAERAAASRRGGAAPARWLRRAAPALPQHDLRAHGRAVPTASPWSRDAVGSRGPAPARARGRGLLSPRGTAGSRRSPLRAGSPAPARLRAAASPAARSSAPAPARRCGRPGSRRPARRAE